MQRRINNQLRAVHPSAALWHTTAGTGVEPEVSFLVELWRRGPHTESTTTRLGELMTRLGARLEATGVASLVDVTAHDAEGFVWAPTRRGRQPSIHTVHLRRTAIRDLYRTLRDVDPTATDPSVDISLPDKRGGRTRPLTDGEIDLVRTAALGRARYATRTALVVALCEATATTSELARLQWQNVDLDTGTVQLPGATPIRPRTGHLTDWGHALVRHTNGTTANRIGDSTARIIERTGAGSAHSQQASMSNLLCRLLADAGVRGSRCKPSSIRLWAAHRQLLANGIEAAAQTLGIDSLDATALALDHQWQRQS